MSRPVVVAIIGFATAIAALGLAVSLGFDDGDGHPGVPAPLPPSQDGAPSETAPPGFDVVRIGERGDAVLAGRGQPKAEIIVLDGDRELGRAMADDRGEWVLVPEGALPPGARTLSIEAHNTDGTVSRSRAPVILVVPESAAQPVLALSPLAGGGARLMTGPGGEPGPVSVDLVERGDAGRLFLGGRAQPGATIHLYLDDKFLGRALTDGDGGWRWQGPTAATGRVLRADLVDGKGKVQARLEFPVEIAPVNVADGVVVEPGTSLWKIARRLYGSGPAFTVIYQANKDRIRDPDLIYPGQVFVVPRD